MAENLPRLSYNPLLIRESLACPSAYERSLIEKCVRVPKDPNLRAVEARAQLNPGLLRKEAAKEWSLEKLKFYALSA
ncbi:hypothetical protein AFLA_009654 [Aspergillus flavus NRRL3357]|nr:hypothetical protein AFLA_009654 [Aspergillus flavus NRRL3357]